jgi:hypothetical protein
MNLSSGKTKNSVLSEYYARLSARYDSGGYTFKGLYQGPKKPFVLSCNGSALISPNISNGSNVPKRPVGRCLQSNALFKMVQVFLPTACLSQL